MADYKVNLVENETPTIQEREEQVLEDAGVDTKQEDGVYKVNMSEPKTEDNAVQESETEGEVLRNEEPQVELQEVGQENETVSEEEITNVLQEVTDEEELQVQSESSSESSKQEPTRVEEEEKVNSNLPENIQDLVKFMDETGGSLEDYVRLNADYSNVDSDSLLKEYYKQKKPHLSNEEIDFLLEDKFSFDEDMDDERDIRRKKLAFKEEVAEAKDYLNSLKDKYYKEVKLSSKLSQEQQKAIDFFNRYNQEQSEVQQAQQQQLEKFQAETNKVFNENFKGFDFKVGDKKYRFNVKDPSSVKDVQSDIFKAFSNYLDDSNGLKDGAGYHKALFSARNADAIANHFYEQGKADAIKTLDAQSKNINMDPRKSGIVEAGGSKVRVISGDDSSKLRIKLKQ
jgi:hypothetical protein